MKNVVVAFLCLLLLSCFDVCSDQYSERAPVILHIHNNLAQENNQRQDQSDASSKGNVNFSNRTNADSKNTVSSYSNLQNHNVQDVITHIMQAAHKKGAEALYTLAGVMNHYKYSMSASALVAWYVYVLYCLRQGHERIHAPGSWSLWYERKSFDELLKMPHQQLEADLLFEFQHRCIDPVDPTNFVYSLVHSSQSLDEEIALVQNQILMYQRILQLRLGRLFFIDEHSLQALQEKQRRLGFMKYIFNSWCAAYKIDKSA